MAKSTFDFKKTQVRPFSFEHDIYLKVVAAEFVVIRHQIENFNCNFFKNKKYIEYIFW